MSSESAQDPLNKDLRFEILTKEHIKGTSVMISEAFQRESLTRYVQLDPETFRCWTDPLCQRAVSLGVSYVAITKDTNEVVGACISIDGAKNDVQDGEDPSHKFEFFDLMIHRLRRRYFISRGFKPLFSDVDPLFKDEPTDHLVDIPIGKYLNLIVMAVDERFQGRRLNGRLCELSLKKATEAGFIEVFTEATNNRSQKSSKLLGFTCEQIVHFQRYRDPEGKRPYSNFDANQPFGMFFTKKLSQ
eukprot:TRINITY_DN17339_c0_g1_i1.p1 TRINITY_DN17339_c0_g1~~TRINITY_DN17339_c0_g1_i1.p1  ORF type:complete len:245 (-),score=57.06 TRINITY_DN17339_c0_g1_i1:12-746(-)